MSDWYIVAAHGGQEVSRVRANVTEDGGKLIVEAAEEGEPLAGGKTYDMWLEDPRGKRRSIVWPAAGPELTLSPMTTKGLPDG